MENSDRDNNACCSSLHYIFMHFYPNKMNVTDAAVDAIEATHGREGKWLRGGICEVICKYKK